MFLELENGRLCVCAGSFFFCVAGEGGRGWPLRRWLKPLSGFAPVCGAECQGFLIFFHSHIRSRADVFRQLLTGRASFCPHRPGCQGRCLSPAAARLRFFVGTGWLSGQKLRNEVNGPSGQKGRPGKEQLGERVCPVFL